jgi:hypothetical protein
LAINCTRYSVTTATISQVPLRQRRDLSAPQVDVDAVQVAVQDQAGYGFL